MHILLKFSWYSPQDRPYVSYKINLSVSKWVTTIQSMLYNNNGIKLEKIPEKNLENSRVFGNLTYTIQNNQWTKTGSFSENQSVLRVLVVLNLLPTLESVLKGNTSISVPFPRTIIISNLENFKPPLTFHFNKE